MNRGHSRTGNRHGRHRQTIKTREKWLKNNIIYCQISCIPPRLWLYDCLTSSNLSLTLTNLWTVVKLDCSWQMGVDVENTGMVQLVSLRASWLVYIYFLLGLWPSCSRSHLAPWACHVTWTCVCSSVAQVLSFLFLCVSETRVMTI